MNGNLELVEMQSLSEMPQVQVFLTSREQSLYKTGKVH